MYKKHINSFFIAIMLTITACNSVKIDMEKIKPQVANAPMLNMQQKDK
ncbi:hypothetical protein [Helicobacter trogontum]|nr:hypothetical protein [Helicobacter trogontum]